MTWNLLDIDDDYDLHVGSCLECEADIYEDDIDGTCGQCAFWLHQREDADADESGNPSGAAMQQKLASDAYHIAGAERAEEITRAMRKEKP